MIQNLLWPNIIQHRNNPPIEDATIHEFFVTSKDHVSIFCRNYQQTSDAAGTVFFMHGFTANSGNYVDLCKKLNSRYHVNVLSLDFRHHGRSDDKSPSFGTAESWDIQAAIDWAEQNTLPRPYVLIGESLGALASQRLIQEDPRISGCICIHPPGWPWDAIGKNIAWTAPALQRLLPKGTEFLVQQAGALINKEYGFDILTDGDVRTHPSNLPGNPLVLYIFGKNDPYDYTKALDIWRHFYPEESACPDVWPAPESTQRKYFIAVEGFTHHPGPTVFDWEGFWHLLDTFFEKLPEPTFPKPTLSKHAQTERFQTLVWEDHFDGNHLDYSKWECMVNAFGGGNKELQVYTDSSENVCVENSLLIIEAHRNQTSIMGTTRDYSSGFVRTKHRGDWCFGRFEICARLPFGQGLWPAIWMLPTDEVYGSWAASGEIDIMEAFGRDPSAIEGTLHFGGAWPKNQYAPPAKMVLPENQKFYEAFHVFAIEWTSERISWFVDDTCFATVKNTDWFTSSAPAPAPFNQAFHLILNLAVGGRAVDPPNSNTEFPAKMEVDWVRVYQ